MRIVDANILLYAIEADMPQHARAKAWWESALGDGGVIGLPWISVLAFLRIATNHRVFRRPLGVDEAMTLIADWLTAPGVSLVDPGPTHAEVLRRTAKSAGVRGPELMDAHVAALAIERSATLVSADRGFARFRELKWINPLE